MHDSHTPQVIKVQMGLLALTLIAMVAPIFISSAVVVAAGLWLLLLSSMLPLLVKIARRDPAIMLIAPVLIVLRAFALGTGLVIGLVRFHRS
jgi:hypothetical protein